MSLKILIYWSMHVQVICITCELIDTLIGVEFLSDMYHDVSMGIV